MADPVFGILLTSTTADEASDPLDRTAYERTVFQQVQSGTSVITEIQARIDPAGAWATIGVLNGNAMLLVDGPYGAFRAVRDSTTTAIVVYFRSDRYTL